MTMDTALSSTKQAEAYAQSRPESRIFLSRTYEVSKDGPEEAKTTTQISYNTKSWGCIEVSSISQEDQHGVLFGFTNDSNFAFQHRESFGDALL